MRFKLHVPAKYDCVSSDYTLRLTVALQAAQEWRRCAAPLLVLSGPVGTGKSLAAAWALWDWWVASARRNPWGKLVYHEGRCWIAAPHLARLQAWSEDVQAIEAAPILVLDDLGEEEATPRILSLISGVITTRFAEQRPSIITTNLDGKTFRDRYGERLIDRLRESGLRQDGKARWWIKCDGKSLRGTVEPERKPPPPPDPTESEAEQLEGDEVGSMAQAFLRSIKVEDLQ